MDVTWLKVVVFIFVFVAIIAAWLILSPSLQPTDEVLLIGASLYVFIITCIVLLFFRVPKHPENINSLAESSNIGADNIKHAWRTREIWKILNVIWISIYFYLNILMILLPILVIYATQNGNSGKVIVVYSTISICGTCASWLIRPKEQAHGYRVAFESLNSALNHFFAGEKAWQDVLEAIDKGEKIINETTYDSI